jgi:hypothetical protein
MVLIRLPWLGRSVAGPLLAARALPLRCAAGAGANFYTGYAKLRCVRRSYCLTHYSASLNSISK